MQASHPDIEGRAQSYALQPQGPRPKLGLLLPGWQLLSHGTSIQLLFPQPMKSK